MDCTKFQQKINDFIYDKIKYSDDLEEFIEHYKNCDRCNEELKLYYNLIRGFGEIEAPYDSDNNLTDTNQELKYIIEYYEDIFKKQKRLKKSGKISIFVFVIMVVCAVVYAYLRIEGII